MKYLTDYLPIKNPLKYEPEDKHYFYKNIVSKLIEDIVLITNNGIPINLDKVKILEKELDNIINQNNEILKNNYIIQKFINSENKFLKENKKNNIQIKNIENFIVDFNINKNIHINYLIDIIIDEMIENNTIDNSYKRLNKTNWTQKKLKDILNKTNNNLIRIILDKDYNNIILNKYKDKAILKLAEDKYNIELKKLELKQQQIEDTEQYSEFNSLSSTQIAKLFDYIGLESRIKTATGNDSFNKEALQEILEIIDNKIYQLEEKNE